MTHIDSYAKHLSPSLKAASVGDINITTAEATRLLLTQQTLIRDGMRGDENALIALGGPLAHIPNVGLLMKRTQVSLDDELLRNPQVNANLVPYDLNGDLDRADMLRGAWRWADPIGTCFMIGGGTIMTARHNFIDPDFIDLLNGHMYVVFGHTTQRDGTPMRGFTVNQDVFRVISPGAYQPNIGDDDDWIMLQLEDPGNVLARRAAATLKSPFGGSGRVYTLGHPNGLTLRYSRSPTIEQGPSALTFRAFLDAYHLSSGSPVFDFESDALVGIVIAGSLGSGKATVDGGPRCVSRICVDKSIVATLCVATDAFAQLPLV